MPTYRPVCPADIASTCKTISRISPPTLVYDCKFVGQEDNGVLNNNTGYSTGMTDPNHEGYGGFTIYNLISGNTGEQHTAPPIGQLLSNDATAANMPAGDTDHNHQRL